VKYNMAEYLKAEELKDGFLYKIDARNASFGIWKSEKNSFLISRIKLCNNFIFEEIHWDKDEHFGTVRPLMEIEESPFNSLDIKLRLLKHKNSGEEYYGYVPENEILEYLNKFEDR